MVLANSTLAGTHHIRETLVAINTDNSLTWTEKLYKGYWLMDHGYRVYIAARFLLNNYLIAQGLTLASTAVEKYLKTLRGLASSFWKKIMSDSRTMKRKIQFNLLMFSLIVIFTPICRILNNTL